ncbi:MAG: transposase, partial [Ruminococcus sp.]|nr:transposase [Ruminococcus sp.]
MAKYSYEFKKKVVTEYLNGEGGYEYLSTKHGIPSQTVLRRWISAYKEFGDEG